MDTDFASVGSCVDGVFRVGIRIDFSLRTKAAFGRRPLLFIPPTRGGRIPVFAALSFFRRPRIENRRKWECVSISYSQFSIFVFYRLRRCLDSRLGGNDGMGLNRPGW